VADVAGIGNINYGERTRPFVEYLALCCTLWK
jgi:hypothetical protein